MTALGSLVHAFVLSPLPYPDGDRLVLVLQHAPATGLRRLPLSDASFFHYREGARSFAELVVGW